MLPLGIVLCWFVVVTHTLFRSAEGIVWVPYSIVFPLILAAPRLFYRLSSWLRSRVTPEWIDEIEQISLVAVLFNIPAVLFFHVKFPEYQYDRFVHFGGAFVGVWWQALVAAPFRFSASRRRLLTVLGISVFISMFAWEGFQWAQDQLFASHTFYDYAQPITVDVWEDIVYGFIGMVIGLWSLNAKFPRYLSFKRQAVVHN